MLTLKRELAYLLPLLAASTLVSSSHASVLDVNYWAEKSTDVNGIYSYNAAATTMQGGLLIGAIPTDSSPSLPNTNVVNYLRTDSSLTGAAAFYDGSLLGDLSAKTGLTATFSLNDSVLASGDSFLKDQLVGQDIDIQIPALRLYFGTTSANRWWSNPGAVHVTSMTNGNFVTLTEAFDPSKWSNVNGKIGTDPLVAGEFTGALSNVTMLGISFGSGYFFSNGFGFNTGGTASIQLSSIDTTTAAPEPGAMGIVAGALCVIVAIRRKRATLSLLR